MLVSFESMTSIEASGSRARAAWAECTVPLKAAEMWMEMISRPSSARGR